MAFTGMFSATNSTGAQIYNVVVQHCANTEPTSAIPITSLGIGASTQSKKFDASSFHHDYWFVSFTDANGYLWTGNVNFAAKSDAQPVQILLYKTYFLVEINGVGSSSQVNYDQMEAA